MLYFFTENVGINAEVLAYRNIFVDRIIYDLVDLEQILPFLTKDDLCVVLINGFNRVSPARLCRILNDAGTVLKDGIYAFQNVAKQFSKGMVEGKSVVPIASKLILLTDVPFDKMDIVQIVYSNDFFTSDLQLYSRGFVEDKKVQSYLNHPQTYLYKYCFGDMDEEELKKDFEKCLQITKERRCAWEKGKVYDKSVGVDGAGNLQEKYVEQQRESVNKPSKHIFRSNRSRKGKLNLRDSSVKDRSVSWVIAYMCMKYSEWCGDSIEMNKTDVPVLHIQDKNADDKREYIKEIKVF